MVLQSVLTSLNAIKGFCFLSQPPFSCRVAFDLLFAPKFIVLLQIQSQLFVFYPLTGIIKLNFKDEELLLFQKPHRIVLFMS